MGKLKKYSIMEMNEKRANKFKFELVEALRGQISEEELKGKMLDTIHNNGVFYYVAQKNVVSGIVAFKLTSHKTDEFEIIKSGNIAVSFGEEKFDTVDAYELDYVYMTEELAGQEADLVETVFGKLKEVVARKDSSQVKVFIWGDNVLVDNYIGKSKSSSVVIGVSIGLCFGATFGLLYDDMALGMCIGLALGLAIGAGNYSVGRKK